MVVFSSGKTKKTLFWKLIKNKSVRKDIYSFCDTGVCHLAAVDLSFLIDKMGMINPYSTNVQDQSAEYIPEKTLKMVLQLLTALLMSIFSIINFPFHCP